MTSAESTWARQGSGKLSGSEWESLRTWFESWSRLATQERGSFFQADVVQASGISQGTFHRLVRPFLEDGRLADLGHLRGYARTGIGNVVTLADLMDLARRCVDPSIQAKRGRPPVEKDRRIERITEGQYQDMQTVARLIAEEVKGDPTEWRGVGGAYFSWDASAGAGAAGAWDLAAKVAQWTEDRHRAKAEVKGRRWDSSQAKASVVKYAGASNRLLDLAATHGILAQNLRHSEAYNVHAAEWEPRIQRWSEGLARRWKARKGTRRKIRSGCRTLALYATRSGSVDPKATDWVAVRDAIVADRERGAITYDVMTWARRVYRYVWDRLGDRPEGSEWRTAPQARTRLVDGRAISAAAQAEADFSLWTTGGGRHAAGLVSGDYGLGRWLRWATARNRGALWAGALPDRAWPRPTAEERRRLRRKPDLFKLTRRVAKKRLELFALVAGWLEREKGVDWSVEDPTRLVDPTFAYEFVAWCADRLGFDDDKSSTGAQALFALATLASPFLEAAAFDLGDVQLADEMRDASDALKEIAIEAQAEERKKIHLIAALWDAGTGKGGWTRLLELRDLLIADAEEAAGCAVAEQIARIEAGTFKPIKSESWALAIRAAVLITMMRKVPVRVRAVSDLELRWWQNVSSHGGRRRTQPWEGAIRLSFPQVAMKSKREFSPWLISPSQVGDEHHERILRRDVLEVYFMGGGARDRILAVDGKPMLSPYVFPATASRGGGHGTSQDDRLAGGFRWEEGSISSHFSKVVLDHAEKMGMDRAALEAQWGATSLHVLRLLYGTYWANVNLMACSLMLQHANTRVTQEKYCALTAADIDLELGQEPSVPMPGESEDVEDLRRQNGELRAQIQALSDLVSRISKVAA